MMTNDFLKHELATVMEGLQGHLQEIARVHRERAELTASASAHDKRVTVTVDANGILTKIRFADDIGDLTYDEIAGALTETVQRAAMDAASAGRELVRPLMARRAHWPKLSDLLEGAMDFAEHIPGESRAPMSPPNAPDRIDSADRAGRYAGGASRSMVADDD
ncbi:YbaB/EbfC family nucleoid-associated protein [Nocardia sp. NPDC052566]|uniref:YbaB/EbfC family nucleoid-associated protein n=1 Tax=Nocardia sp. NPDC052566 TaxID=3364330 RepID=UPI0037C75248